jgi:hypothetical protein
VSFLRYKNDHLVALSDASEEFQHAANGELFAYLKQRALDSHARSSVVAEYPFLTHPDLVERLRNLVLIPDTVSSTAYGHPVVANSNGIIFAWAGGMNQIFLRLPRKLQQKAIEEGGRFDPTYGENWIEFLGFGNRHGAHSKAEETLSRWIRIAYDESLKLEAKG